MIQLYHGDGKGKTTAAVGAAVRAAGRGRTVIFAQFLKGQETGEITALSAIRQIRILRSSRDFPFVSRMSAEQKRELTQIHNGILEEIERTLQEQKADFFILDEITHACRYGMIDENRLYSILSYGKGKDNIEMLLTGRKPPQRMLEISDYISEIRCIRHPYEKGIGARYGIEL